MLSGDGRRAVLAFRELESLGWLQDGSLKGLNLSGAYLAGVDLSRGNLQEANLSHADLEDAAMYSTDLRRACLASANFRYADIVGSDLAGADLSYANLETALLEETNLQETILKDTNLRGAMMDGSDLRGAIGLDNEQLVNVDRLCGAIMPDGSRYDGRYNLKGDFWVAHDMFDVPAKYRGASKAKRFDLNNPIEMAAFYGIPLGEYLAGQLWARENLPKLRGES